MHTLIYSIVSISDRTDLPDTPEELALNNAQTAFNRLVGIGEGSSQIFDYYTTFDDTTSNASGPGRYGDLPVAAEVTSDEGQRMLDSAWESTVGQFETNLQRVRELLDELSDEEIMQNKGMSRSLLSRASMPSSPDVHLYDEFGNGVTTESRLSSILDNEDDLWIVPADVHY